MKYKYEDEESVFIIRCFRQDRLSELHSSLEPDLSEARASGLSLTQWRMAARLRRNEVMASEVRREHTRALARTILSPAQQTRLSLLQVYLDKVSLRSPGSYYHSSFGVVLS